MHAVYLINSYILFSLLVIIKLEIIHADSISILDAHIFKLLDDTLLTQKSLEKGKALLLVHICISEHFLIL